MKSSIPLGQGLSTCRASISISSCEYYDSCTVSAEVFFFLRRQSPGSFIRRRKESNYFYFYLLMLAASVSMHMI